MDAQLPGPYLYTFIAMTGLVAVLVGILLVALWRFSAAAREARRATREDRQSEQTFVTGAVQDALTRLRTQERALQARAEASERLSDTIVAGITSGLVLVDVEARVRIVNPAARRLLALGPTEGSPLLRILLARAQPLVEVVEEGLRTQSAIVRRVVTVPVPAEASGRTLSDRHFGVTVSPLHNADGSLRGVICLFTDLTKVVALEEQVRLKESLARLGELTAGLAHELRNSLATVHGYARLLDPETLGPPHDGYVRAMREETEALGEIVTNFLNFAKPARLVLANVELQHLVSKVVDEMRHDAAALGGTLVQSGRFGAVEGDELLLRQAISNLCRNALEACAASGITPDIVVEGEAELENGHAVVRVRDNGPGFRPHPADRLFQPFFTTKASGTGLGLALVQKIAVTHNGQASAVNQAEGGASFELRLPLATHAAAFTAER